MHISEDKPKMIFKYIKDDKEYYSIGLSTKGKDGNYQNGYMNCRFRKDVKLENKTRIKLIDAWVDFYIKDKITYPYIFINKFETIEDEQIKDIPQNTKTEYDDLKSDVELEDSDLPF